GPGQRSCGVLATLDQSIQTLSLCRTELNDILLSCDLFRGHESAPSLRHGAIDSDILLIVNDVADYAQEARDDLEAARGWLTKPGSGPAARRKLAAIRADIQRLQQHPCLWPAGDHPSVRKLPAAGGYRAFYKVEPDTGRDDTAGDVRVLRVYGPGQDRRRL
ncbi:MAG TPA: type II toxin-antitoxin system RelE/ParE family toxin, partial [Acetobacteraceae bacterium]|nr:type II toxin-antitoxin system RelE/ParE family toxin [Acetobacteraceae bacterium]